MLIVGLTGGISSGKSTVSSTLNSKYNLTVIDADLIAKEVVLPGRKAYKQIVETFGDDIPDLVDPETKMLNRAALGKNVFPNKANLRKLNGIVHPAVKHEIAWQIIQAFFRFQKLVILDVPLLFESGLNVICGKTISVTCNPELQLERLLLRNPELSKEDAENRIASQGSSKERVLRSDIVIDNNGTKLDLETSIESVVQEITPSAIWTILDFIPGVVFLSAGITFAITQFKDSSKRKKIAKSN